MKAPKRKIKYHQRKVKNTFSPYLTDSIFFKINLTTTSNYFPFPLFVIKLEYYIKIVWGKKSLQINSKLAFRNPNRLDYFHFYLGESNVCDKFNLLYRDEKEWGTKTNSCQLIINLNTC